MAPSCSNCCNVELEIVEMKNFISRWFDVFSRRFDDQDKKLTILVDAISAVNFDSTFPIGSNLDGEVYGNNKNNDDVDISNSNNICVVDDENEDLRDISGISYDDQSECLDNHHSSNVSRLLIHKNISSESNIITDQILDTTTEDLDSLGHIQSAISVYDDPIKVENSDELRQPDDDDDVFNYFPAATSYNPSCSDIQGTETIYGHSSLGLDDPDNSFPIDSQPGTSSNNSSFLFYNTALKKRLTPSTVHISNRPYYSNSSHLAKRKSAAPKASTDSSSLISSVQQPQQAATELRRSYLSRLNKFTTRPHTSAINQNNDHRNSASSNAINKAAINLHKVCSDYGLNYYFTY